MNKMTKILALVMAMLMVLPVLAACKKDGGETDKPTAEPGKETQVPSSNAEYTYNLTMGASPATWNPHTWETNADSEIMSYLEMPFVDTTIADDGVNFKWVYEMATSVEDVTATYEDREKWLVAGEDGSLPTANVIYKIELNPNAKWQDGTPINADTYIYSMQQCISPEMKNYRANSYTEGSSAIKNAKAYFNNDKAGKPNYIDAAGQDVEGKDLIVSVDAACVFFGGALKDYSADYADYFKDADGNDLYKVIEDYVKANGTDGYAVVDEATLNAIKTVAENFGQPQNYLEFLFIQDGLVEEMPWENVGLIKGGDYTLYYVLENAETEFYFLTSLTSNWIVYKDLYEAGKETINDLVSTDYGTEIANYQAFGPYKLTSFEKDKQFVLERNENWYGWTDGNHEGQYQTTKVVYDIVSDSQTALMLFNQGKLDEISLNADDMQIYRASENLLKTDQTYTYRWIFATDFEKLKALENDAGDGSNKQIIGYDEFRHAMSLAINRSELCAQATPGYKPAYYLQNSLYYYNIENDENSIYRNTTQAKEAVLRVYGIEYGEGKEYATVDEAYAAVTGYDVEEAKKLFEEAADRAIAEGRYTEGQEIKITCYATAAQSLSTDYSNECQMINDYFAKATEGTKLEGKITVEYKAAIENRYADIAAGKVEMARGAWGGAAFYPFSSIRVYCEPDYMGGLDAIHESCGFDPTTEKITIPIDGQDKEDTYQNWAKAINDPAQYAGDIDKCLLILSYLESNILSGYHCIPFACDAIVSMYSYQIKYATTNYNIMYGYGGIRLMTYAYDDAGWDAFVKSQGGELDYK